MMMTIIFYELKSCILDETRAFIAWYSTSAPHGLIKLKRKLIMLLMYLSFAHYMKINLFERSLSKQEIKKMKSSINDNKNKNKNNVETPSHVLKIAANMSVKLAQSVILTVIVSTVDSGWILIATLALGDASIPSPHVTTWNMLFVDGICFLLKYDIMC